MKLAIFDFDGTLFTKQTIPFFIEQWHKLNYSKSKLFIIKNRIIFLFIKYKLRLLPKEKFRTSVIEIFPYIFMGMSKKDIVKFFNEIYQEAKLYFNKDVVSEINKAKQQGYYTVLLSGCYSLFLEVVASDLGINKAIGTDLYFYKNKLNYDKKPTHISGFLKQDIVKTVFKEEEIDWQNSLAYADSIADLGLLNLVGKSVVVKPDKRLLKHALKENWQIIK